LYVDVSDDGLLSVPREAVNPDDARKLLDLAESCIELSSAAEPAEELTDQDLAVLTWFMDFTADRTHRKRIFSAASLAKLAELKSSLEWMTWIKAENEAQREEGRALAAAALSKSRAQEGLPGGEFVARRRK